jgi:flagellar basal-body rod protein FlgB
VAFNLDSALGIHPQALILRGKRAGVLAANLANADTPNYKARDIDFKSVLAGKADELAQTRSMKTTHAAHIGGSSAELGAELLYRVPAQPSLDGNTVETQLEKARFTENVLQYQASFTFLNGRIKGIIGALRGE